MLLIVALRYIRAARPHPLQLAYGQGSLWQCVIIYLHIYGPPSLMLQSRTDANILQVTDFTRHCLLRSMFMHIFQKLKFLYLFKFLHTEHSYIIYKIYTLRKFPTVCYALQYLCTYLYMYEVTVFKDY